MNNTFSLRRTLLYARKHYVENARYYGYTLLLFLILLSVSAWYFTIWLDTSGSFSLLVFLLLTLFACLVTRIGCLDHYDRREMPRSYTLPVTTAEKYLFIWFNSSVVATALFALILLPVAALAGALENLVLFTSYPVWLFLFSVQAGLLLSCSWVKGNPLKAFLPLAGAYIAYHAIYFAVLKSAFGLIVDVPFSNIDFMVSSDSALLSFRLPGHISLNAAYTLVFGFWTAVAWLAGYFKFKERTLK